MAECPSCGRFAGPYANCPYCGARLQGRAPLRWLKIAALALAVLGLAGLWFAATRVQIPVVRIDRIGEMMNMAYVRIVGRVSRSASYNPQSQTLSFYVTDASGSELLVTAFRSSAEDLIQEKRIPAAEDQISVAGTLRVREDFTALSLNAPEQLQITRTAAVDAKIGQISAQDVGRRVRVRGQVRQVRSPYSGLTLVSLRDDSGEIVIALGEALTLTGSLPAIVPGQGLEVVAAVSVYGDTPQLVPALAADIVPLTGTISPAEPRGIGSLADADVGKWVRVQGEIVESVPLSGNMKFTLDDGSGQIALFMPQEVYAQVPFSATLGVGGRVQAQGEVKKYKGELEVVPGVPQDVAILVAAAAPEEVTVAALSAADDGRVVILHGVLGPAEPIGDKGVRYPLNDGSGEITLLLWSDVLQGAPAGLGSGAEVRVTGAVQEYEGALEIVPRRGSDIVVLGQQPLPTPTPVAVTPIGTITAAAQGQVLTVEGTLGEPETFSRGIRFPLRDESGEIVLLLWQNVVDALPDAGKLVAGTRVRVTGSVDVYQDALEVVPEAGGIAILP